MAEVVFETARFWVEPATYDTSYPEEIPIASVDVSLSKRIITASFGVGCVIDSALLKTGLEKTLDQFIVMTAIPCAETAVFNVPMGAGIPFVIGSTDMTLKEAMSVQHSYSPQNKVCRVCVRDKSSILLH